MSKEEFIEKAKSVHGEKYDYSMVEYVDTKTKVCIICPKHGEFWQTPKAHVVRGYGCRKCGRELCGEKLAKTTDAFISEARKIHGDKYDYSKVKYINATTKVCIICPKHGEFWQEPHDHLKGVGCPKCGFERTAESVKYTMDEFVSLSRKKHGDKYDYTKTDILNRDEDGKVTITCPIHGDFRMNPYVHTIGQGCPVCGKHKMVLGNSKFIEKSKVIHGGKYSYDEVEYTHSKKPVKIVCPIHGEFEQTPETHLKGCGCPKCGNNISLHENEIYDFLCGLLGKDEVIQRCRTIIPPKEIDIYIPSLKIGIEYNGLRWHSEEFSKDKNYHLNKTLECQKMGVSLMQIFEDEYIEHKDIVLSKIKRIVGKYNDCEKIMGRKCVVREISRDTARIFLEKNHIQGYGSASCSLGAYFHDRLIAVMSFKKIRDNEYELVRFAGDINVSCQGVGGKMFKYFIRNYNPSMVKSFADRRWTTRTDNLYTRIGFRQDSLLRPEYRYFCPKEGAHRFHKFGFRKNILCNKYGLPLTMTETEMIKTLGFERIWDCGLIKYIWKP